MAFGVDISGKSAGGGTGGDIVEIGVVGGVAQRIGRSLFSHQHPGGSIVKDRERLASMVSLLIPYPGTGVDRIRVNGEFAFLVVRADKDLGVLDIRVEVAALHVVRLRSWNIGWKSVVVVPPAVQIDPQISGDTARQKLIIVLRIEGEGGSQLSHIAQA